MARYNINIASACYFLAPVSPPPSPGHTLKLIENQPRLTQRHGFERARFKPRTSLLGTGFKTSSLAPSREATPSICFLCYELAHLQYTTPRARLKVVAALAASHNRIG
ncbi:hypothetical protein O181_048270 [Austropuccinia psidii MF-1]|uniref:Uncharacterized protein n=1 Tax=Austropuccinia psidii MF-1 TaxID=1389203 RepID=A0A9Q3HP19_9BASI|nr:hypothetical protein [Austropuccinia psidii MF-1]